MKMIVFLSLLTCAGCSLPSVGPRSDFDRSLIRTFSSVGIDDETCLRLNADQTYLEYAGAMLNSDTEEERMARGTKGRWEQKNDRLLLVSERGQAKEFKIVSKNGGVTLEVFPGPGFPYK